VLGASLLNVIVVIGVTSWPGTARLVRAQTLSVEGRPYLERARVLGGSNWHQMSKHVLPNVMPLVLANTTLTVAIAILSETTLTFLGLGDPLHVSWGTMLENAFNSGAITLGAWWYLIPPGLCVVIVVLAFTLVGRALEAIVDPHQSTEA
jgi:peptide/nickel transport system permease protein